ncbi:MAG: VPLPA-CTERM sorting domain-containing protein [Gammaproteobacteria bacterium]
MKQRFFSFGLAFLFLSSVASATTVQLGVQNPNVTVDDQVAEAAYRLSQSDWDQMLSNGADPAGASDMATINHGGATALSGTTWDFTVTYESGDDGLQGFTFEIVQDGGPGTGTLVYDLGNPLNGQTPTGTFNAIEIEARAANLSNETSYIETAAITISDLTFTSSQPSIGSFENPLDASFLGEQINSNWAISSVDMNLFDWTLTGTVSGQFDCNGGGSTGCLTDDSVMMSLKFVDVSSVIPVPASAWLFCSALIGLAGLRRKN